MYRTRFNGGSSRSGTFSEAQSTSNVVTPLIRTLDTSRPDKYRNWEKESKEGEQSGFLTGEQSVFLFLLVFFERRGGDENEWIGGDWGTVDRLRGIEILQLFYCRIAPTVTSVSTCFLMSITTCNVTSWPRNHIPPITRSSTGNIFAYPFKVLTKTLKGHKKGIFFLSLQSFLGCACAHRVIGE